MLFAGLPAVPGVPIEVSLIAEAWKVAQQGWAAGGLAFVLFVLVLALFSEELVSGRRHRSTIAEWQARYIENNTQWLKRLEDAERERDLYLQMLFARESTVTRSIKAAETVAVAAQAVVDTAVSAIPAGLPPPVVPKLRWWQR